MGRRPGWLSWVDRRLGVGSVRAIEVTAAPRSSVITPSGYSGDYQHAPNSRNPLQDHVIAGSSCPPSSLSLEPSTPSPATIRSAPAPTPIRHNPHGATGAQDRTRSWSVNSMTNITPLNRRQIKYIQLRGTRRESTHLRHSHHRNSVANSCLVSECLSATPDRPNRWRGTGQLRLRQTGAGAGGNDAKPSRS